MLRFQSQTTSALEVDLQLSNRLMRPVLSAGGFDLTLGLLDLIAHDSSAALKQTAWSRPFSVSGWAFPQALVSLLGVAVLVEPRGWLPMGKLEESY
jgi:hypothetical protein